MNNNKIEKMVDRLINVDQKDNILAQNLHKNFLVEHNLKENFKIMLNNEEKLLDKNKFGPAFKIVLEENINYKEKLPTAEDIIRIAIKNNATQKDVVAITGMNKSSISNSNLVNLFSNKK